MHIGLFMPSYRSWIDSESIAAIINAAELAGIESLWLPDRISFPQNAGDRGMARPLGSWLRDAKSSPSIDGSHPADTDVGDCFHDPLTLAGFIAACSSRLAIGTGVTILPLRNPLVTARAVATLDRLTGGRFHFGVGAGHVPGEYDAVGVEYGNRMDILEESIAAMGVLWEQDSATFQGRHVRFADQRLMIRSARRPRPRVVAGGHGKRALQIAAEYCDGWIASYLEPAEMRRGVEYIRSASPERPDREFEVSVLVKSRLVPGPDGRPSPSASGRLSLDPRGLDVLSTAYAKAGCDRVILQLPTRDLPLVLGQIAAVGARG